MPEYNCVNIGTEGYPVWLTLSEKATIAAIEPAKYMEAVAYTTAEQFLLKTVVTLVVAGCCVEVKSPLPVETICRILGFMWDERDVAAKPAPAEEAAEAEAVASEDEKTEGGGPQ